MGRRRDESYRSKLSKKSFDPWPMGYLSGLLCRLQLQCLPCHSSFDVGKPEKLPHQQGWYS